MSDKIDKGTNMSTKEVEDIFNARTKPDKKDSFFGMRNTDPLIKKVESLSGQVLRAVESIVNN